MSTSDKDNPFAAPAAMESPTSETADVNYEELQTVGNGLNLVYWSLILLVLTVIGGVSFGILMRSASQRSVQFVSFALLTGLPIVSVMIAIVGKSMCITVPERCGGRGLAIASLSMLGLSLLIAAAGFFAAKYSVGFALLGSGWSGLLQLLSVFLFLLFLRKVSKFINDDRLARGAVRILLFASLLVVAYFLVPWLFLFAGIDERREILIAFLFGAGFATLIVFLMYANLVNAVSLAIRKPGAQSTTRHLI